MTATAANPQFIAFSMIMDLEPVNISLLLVGTMLSFVSKVY